MLLGTALVAVSCYSPNIQPGGFACHDAGASACPDNFTCNPVDHRCYEGPHDASVEKPACKSATNVATPVCTPATTTGECSPACQTGCDGCGWCAVVNGVPKCVTGMAGTKDVGTICDPTLQQDCKVELYCQPGCGSKGRCYRFCNESNKAVCGAGSTCGTNPKSNAGTGLLSSVDKLCNLVDSCDPITQMGCPAPFACYPTTTTNVNECDCPGTVATGTGCSFIAQCIAGDSCFGPPGSPNTCLQICMTSATCASGTSCMNPASAMYGYCL